MEDIFIPLQAEQEVLSVEVLHSYVIQRRGNRASVVGEVTMELSAEQLRAVENGEAVPVIIQHTKCILIRADIYERVKALIEIEETYPLIDETFKEGWEAPGMADYDRYDELKRP